MPPNSHRTNATATPVRPRLNDVLFNTIEDMQVRSGKSSFGKFLDAGTGVHSLRWMASLLRSSSGKDDHDGVCADTDKRAYIDKFFAVTADESMRQNVRLEAAKLGILDDEGEIVIGNWASVTPFEEATTAIEVASSINYLCKDEMFDTILADYLVGAMDGFSPYFQDQIFDRLFQHLKPGGRIYVVGLQPIPDKAYGDADIFCRITKIRDACILLARHRCYREYPQDWIERHMVKAGLQIVETKRHPILYSYDTMRRQIDVARSKLSLFPSQDLADEMGKTLDNLDAECKKAFISKSSQRIQLGFDYIVCAKRP